MTTGPRDIENLLYRNELNPFLPESAYTRGTGCPVAPSRSLVLQQ